MDKDEKKTKYLCWLEMLEAELNSIKAVSAGGVKLALLHVLYDVQRVRETFEQVKAKVASNEYTRDLLEIDEDVDYLMWAERLKKCVSIQKLYVAGEIEHSGEYKNIKKSFWGIVDAFNLSEKDNQNVNKEEFLGKVTDLLWYKVNEDQLRQMLNCVLLELYETLTDIANEMNRRRLTLEDGEQLYKGLEFRYNLAEFISTKRDWDNWQAEWEDDEDEEVILRHARGKWYEELLLLFKSGFLTPKLTSQREADMEEFDGEIKVDYFEGVPAGMDLRRHYSALRDLLQYKDNCFQPKKGMIGKYIFKNRKLVRDEQRHAFFRFLRMMKWLEELREVKQLDNSHSTIEKKTQKQTNEKIASFVLVVTNAACPEKVIARLHELMDERTSPKDVMMPIRAAFDAGVIRHPTWSEFCAEFGSSKLKSKTSFNDYLNVNYKYDGESFKVMVENFRAFLE